MDADLPTVLLVAGRFQLRGTSTYTLRLAEGLRDEGFQSFIICPDAEVVSRDLREKLRIREYSYLDSPLLSHLATVFAARDAAREHPVLVHTQSRSVMRIGQSIARRLKLPSIVTVHDYLNENEVFPFDLVTGRRIIAVSESVRSGLLRHRAAPNDLVTVISSGVPIPSDSDNSTILSVKRRPVIGTAGALETSKGIGFFLDAARLVLNAGHDAEFLIAGTGPEEAALRQKVRALELVRNVTFIPNLPEFDAALKAMDIFCLPSLRQGLGTIMLEAMALARPVIATGTGGTAEIVEDGRTGLVVPPGNPERLAARIIELLNDPLRARALGCAARTKVTDEFNARRMVSATAAEYRHVLATEETLRSASGRT